MYEKFELDENLEFQIIKNILNNRQFLVSIIEHLHPEFFTNNTANIAALIIKEHFETYSEAPAIDIIKVESKNHLTPKDDIELFSKELETISNLEITNAEYLKAKVLEHCQFNALKRAILNSTTLLTERTDNYKSQISDQFKRALSIAENSNLGLSYFKDIDQRLINELRYKKYIKTGISSLDRITGGGWSVEDTTLAIIVAPTGIGKSIFLCKFGSVAVLLGHKVVHITHELSEERTASRYDSLFTKLAQGERLDKREELLKKLTIVKSMCGGDSLKIKEFPTHTCSTNQIRAYIEKLKQIEDFEPDLIISDYLDIMVCNYNAYSEDDYRAQKRISEELRALAQELHIPVLTASQTNRGASDKDVIGNTDIAESYGKVFNADILMTVNQTMKERLENRCNLYIAKYRNGPSGILIPLNIMYEYMNLQEITDTTYKQNKEQGEQQQ